VELAQEPALDRVAGGAADHRVDAALRAQRGLGAVDPGLDVRARERLEAEKQPQIALLVSSSRCLVEWV